MKIERVNKRDRAIIASLLGMIAVLYVASLIVFRGAVSFDSETFAGKPIASRVPLDVYVDMISFDPVREEINLKIDVMGASGSYGKNYALPLNRDIELRIGDGETDHVLEYKRAEKPESRAMTVETDGVIARYPFDRYASRLFVRAYERSSSNVYVEIPIVVTIWKGLPGWSFDLEKMPAQPEAVPNLLTLGVHIRRPAPFVFFASTLYVLMVVIAAAALTLGGLVFLALRKVEGTLMSALVAMVFALPALRNALPGGPPLGVTGDIVILLWAEIIVAFSIVLFVTSWARRGSGN